MKISAVILTALSLLLALPLAQAQEGAAPATAQQVSFSQPQLEKFADAYRQIVVLSKEYAPKLKAAADIEEAEALNKEAQGKMLEAIQGSGLTKDEYQQIATGLKSDPSLVEKVNKILQQKAGSE
ncbi:DUF4168 domain-containing protein [Microbulbifer halophilus]|uniref:DUF4168 domain-containing protein n=1 Tax=Microbulbifer halophilus TaxID=453963 RepID=A0ABW5E7C2_9GAMM|nr:DUF4168 domain-containing protein [Microbulbifer halophilus]MCW8126741.1 DUF4168 domain-containing protein [Microbulbifer halophilus]